MLGIRVLYEHLPSCEDVSKYVTEIICENMLIEEQSCLSILNQLFHTFVTELMANIKQGVMAIICVYGRELNTVTWH